jgi:hypothetical protein
MQLQQEKHYSLTETIVALYSVNDFVLGEQPAPAPHTPADAQSPPALTEENLWSVFSPMNPMNSFLAWSSAELVEWIFTAPQFKEMHDKLRNWILPPDQVTVSLKRFKTTLRIIANFPPVKMMCLDTAILASRAQTVLSLTPKIQACITQTGKIAYEILDAEVSISGKKVAHAGAKSVLEGVSDWLAPGLDADLRKRVVNAGAKLASTTVTTTANQGIKLAIDTVVNKTNAELAEHENKYLIQASQVIYEGAAKQVVTYACNGIAVAAVSAAWFLPAVITNTTKWAISCVVSEPVAEAATTAVKVIGTLYTCYGLFRTTSAYDAQRRAKQQRFEPIQDIETKVVNGLVDKVKTKLPSSGDSDSIGKKFVARCSEELPEVFSNAGHPQP